MKNEIDSKLILSVFEKIRQNGQQSDEGHLLDGVRASTDFDGYTLYLSDALVSLSFGFHNQYHFEYQSQEQFEQFYKKLNAIQQQY